MGARGRKRQRKDGSVASGKLQPSANPAGPIKLRFREEPLDPVDPAYLARALTVGLKHYPFDASELASIEMEDETGYELDARFRAAVEELVDELGDRQLAGKVDSRADLLRDFLGKDGASYYAVSQDGEVQVREDLLVFAASTPITSHPNERLSWSPPT